MRREEMQEQLHIRLTHDEAVRIRRKAEKAGITVSEYVRRCCLNKQVKEINPQLLERFKECSATMGKLGSNINQIARYLNSSGNSNYLYLWFDEYQKDMDDARMKLKIIMEKNLAA